jgi:hypothetical protein
MWILRFFPKVLNDRLTPMMDKLVSGSHTTFIKRQKYFGGSGGSTLGGPRVKNYEARCVVQDRF